MQNVTQGIQFNGASGFATNTTDERRLMRNKRPMVNTLFLWK